MWVLVNRNKHMQQLCSRYTARTMTRREYQFWAREARIDLNYSSAGEDLDPSTDFFISCVLLYQDQLMIKQWSLTKTFPACYPRPIPRFLTR